MARTRHGLLSRLSTFFSVAVAISLSDFDPPSYGLSASCNVIYVAPISGCTYSDFSRGLPCSRACIDGMFSLNTAVYQACSSDPRNDQHVIGAFLRGEGITSLCPNVEDQSFEPSLPQSSAPAAISTHVPPPIPAISSSIPLVTPSPIITPSPTTTSRSTKTIHITSTSVTSILLGPPLTYSSTSTSTPVSSLSSTSVIEVKSKSIPAPQPATASATDSLSREHCGSPFDWCSSDGSSPASATKISYTEALMAFWLIFLWFRAV